jgi:hypothetical protein
MITNTITLKCTQGLENLICSRLIGSKGRNIWAIKNEFGDDQFCLSCELMDEVENVTFITYSITNTFCAKAIHDKIINNLSLIIYQSKFVVPESNVELNAWFNNERTKYMYINGDLVTNVKSTNNTHIANFADSDFPTL